MNHSRERLFQPYETIPENPIGMDNINYIQSYDDDYEVVENQEMAVDQMVPNFSIGTYGTVRQGRPMSMYEPTTEGYTSLPVELGASNNHIEQIDVHVQKTAWEAEDASEFITTLDESTILDIESYENLYVPPQQNIRFNETRCVRIAADIHEDNKYEEIAIYATVKKPKPKNVCTQVMVTSGGPVEKFPKIMTASCYGELNNPWSMLRSNDEINAIVRSTENILDANVLMNSTIGNTSITSSITGDGISSVTSSMYEANSMNSSFDYLKCTTSERNNRVKWWDEFSELKEAEFKEIGEQDLAAIKKMLENETGGSMCPSCQMPFDKGKKRKLIDNCGHERCYSCMFRNEGCPLCLRAQEEDNDLLSTCNSKKLHDYDTGIGSTTTLLSPLGSPQPICRSQVKTNGYFTAFMQSRSNLTSPELGKASKTKPPKGPIQVNLSGGDGLSTTKSRGLGDILLHACATPPQNRRRIFNTKNLRSPFGLKHRPSASNLENSTLSGASSMNTSMNSDTPLVTKRAQSNRESHKLNRLSLGKTSTSYAGHLSSYFFGKIKSLWSAQSTPAQTGLNQLADDEGGNVKPMLLNEKSKTSHDELQARLSFMLDNQPRRNGRVGAPIQSCSSLASTNTSPVSTLTGSSEADVSRVIPEIGPYNTNGCDSGSLMSVSISEQSNVSSNSPLSRRHSVTAQQGVLDDLSSFRARKTTARRSARTGQIKGPIDPKVRFAKYRPGPQLTLKPLFFEVPLQESDPPFIGRSWLIRELSTAISASESCGVLLNGNLGSGKTALVLQLVEYSCFGRRKEDTVQEPDGIYCQINVATVRFKNLASHVVAYHFCQADNNSTCLVPDFIHSIAAQLCQAPQLAAYHEFLLGDSHIQDLLSIKQCVANPEHAMKMGILEPLAALRRIGKIPAGNCIILIDALCEAEYHRPDHGDTIASFLARMTEFFPSWLKIIATVRTQMLEFTKSLVYTKVNLDTWTSNEALQKDMSEYITFRVTHSTSIQNNVGALKESTASQQKFSQYLLNLTKGSFLFAKMTLDLIERGHLVVKSSSYKVLPVTLSQLFLLNFNLRFPTQTAYDKVSNILNVCLAALYPLSLMEIFYSVNALFTEEPIEFEEFLQLFKLLSGFLIQRLDNTYLFFHPSFREWLIRRDEGESNKFLCDLRTGHAAIALRMCRMQTPLNAELGLELGHHILKAHIYRNAPQQQSPRDMQAFWVASVSECVSSALCTLRNVFSPNIKVSRLLMLAGASPDHVTGFMGNAPILCIASHEGIVPMVDLLLEFGANVEQTNSQGCTPLMLAASKGHCQLVRQLVAAGSSLGQIDIANRSALVHAAIAGKLKVVKYLVACDWNARPGSTDVTLQESAQQSLIAAARQGNTAVVEDLLDMIEVQVDKLDPITGETALCSSVMNGHTETVTILLSRGANSNISNKKEMSPLQVATKEGHWAIVERLLQNQADMEQTDSNGKTALMIAAEEGHVGIIELLLNRGACLTSTDRDGLTALSWACLRGKQQAAKCLLERNADKQHTDVTGRTPLDLAAYQGSAALVKMLLDYGAQIEHVDVHGMRPLDRAITCRNVQVVQVFLKRGAKLGPTTWAMATGKAEIILILLNKLLDDGNTLYRKNRFQEAAQRYQYALKKIQLSDEHENNTTFQQLKFNFLLNLSRCKRKMNEVADSIELASHAIDIKPNNYDGYYARSKALLEYGKIGEALKDAKTALEHSQSTTQEIRETLARLHNDLMRRQLTSSCLAIETNENNNADVSTDL